MIIFFWIPLRLGALFIKFDSLGKKKLAHKDGSENSFEKSDCEKGKGDLARYGWARSDFDLQKGGGDLARDRS